MTEFASIPMKDKRGYLSTDQANMIINQASNMRDRLILQLMYRCGRRVSEILLMKRDDILWEDGKIIFNILKRKRPIKELKPVDMDTLKLLRMYVDGEFSMKGVRKRMESETLFPVTRQYVFKLVRKLGEQCGINKVGEKKLHPHHFRHSFAVHAVRTTVKSAEDLRKLQMYMGHANMSTTSHYLQFSPEEMRDLVDGMWTQNKKQEAKK